MSTLDSTQVDERRNAEIDLLSAMYPDQVQWSSEKAEFRFIHDSGASLILRLSKEYPERTLPELISATDSRKSDLRQKVTKEIAALRLNEGEEVLDAIVQAYAELLDQDAKISVQSAGSDHQKYKEMRFKTVIVWLHHLLATSKRKLSLNPSTESHLISGATKPGYPGVLLFSGEVKAVEAHVTELKQQRWQAFQIRYETEHSSASSAQWVFNHGTGIHEFETMSEIVQDIADENQKQAFLSAVGVK